MSSTAGREEGRTPGLLSSEGDPDGVVGLYEKLALEAPDHRGTPEPPASAGGDNGGDGADGDPGGKAR